MAGFFRGLSGGDRKKDDDKDNIEISFDSALKLARTGEFDKAIEIAERIEDAKERSEALGLIAPKLAEAGEFDKAIEIAERIENDKLRSGALELIASGLAEAGEFDKAIEIAERIEDDWVRSEALANIASELAEAGEFDKAIEIAESIEDVWWRSKALANIATKLAKVGYKDKAIEIAESIEDAEKRSEALGLIAPKLAEAGEFDKAIEVAESIEDVWWRSGALADIASELAEAGEFDKAIEIAERIEDAKERSKALKWIASELAEAGEFDKAIEVAESIEDVWWRSGALADIATKLTKVGYKDKAKKVFDKAIEIAERIEDDEERSEALGLIAPKLAEAGYKDKAKKVFDKAIEIAESIEDDWVRSRALKWIASGLAEAGEFEKAIEIYEHIGDKRAEELRIVELKQLMSKYPNLSEDIKMRFEEGGDVKTLLTTMKQRISIYEKAKSEVEELRKEIEGLNYEDLREPIRLFEEGDYEGCLESMEKVRAILPEIKNKIKIVEEIKQLIDKYPHLSEDIKPELERFEKDYNVNVQTLLNTLNQRISKYEELKNKLSKLESSVKSAKDLTIPREILERVESVKSTKSLEELEKAVSEIERKINEILNSKPEIKVETLTKEISQGWNPFKVKIKNEGYAHAYDVEISVKGDVNTMSVEPVTVKGLESTTVEIPLKPTETGMIPLEITVKYKDSKNNEFVESSVVWVEVKGETEVKSPAEGLTPAEFTYVESEKAKPAIDFPSQLLSKYEPIELLGEGGFAKVFKCRRKKDGVIVAVKIPIESEEAGRSFIEEVANWKKLKHVNIVQLNDYNALPYPHIEMELCDFTLKDLTNLTLKERLKIACRIADALSYAHSKGIVHGDLKPSNILIKRIGDEVIPKLTDWGMGYTPAYAPPEVVIDGQKPDEPADVWSFGVILYELVTGNNPFQGEDEIETIDRVAELNPDLTPLGVLKPIVAKCLERDREKRYRSMIEVKKDLMNLNISTLSNLFSKSKSRIERIQTAIEITTTYMMSNEFEKAKRRIDSLLKYRYITPRAHEVYRTLIEILTAKELHLSFLESKFKHILELLPDYRNKLEEDEYVGKELRKIIVRHKDVRDVIKEGDEEFDIVRNVICMRILDLLGKIACETEIS